MKINDKRRRDQSVRFTDLPPNQWFVTHNGGSSILHRRVPFTTLAKDKVYNALCVSSNSLVEISTDARVTPVEVVIDIVANIRPEDLKE